MPEYKTSGLGELAQLARAPALHAGGHRFESVILHKEIIDMLEANKQKRENERFA